ncbi:chaperonin 10-like protein [Amylocystis lapponica]|nr:chaperonin 10-like protein [Amylocystis lapponica]
MAATMNAVYYHEPRKFELRKVPVPKPGDNEVLFKAPHRRLRTDGHIHDGEFIAAFPLIPGHEVVGVIAEVGKNVKSFAPGDRCVADPGVTCGSCFYCRRGQACCASTSRPRREPGGRSPISLSCGTAHPQRSDANKVFRIQNLTDEEAVLVEPAACAIHGMDKLGATPGIDALVLGAGPTGLILAQLLKLNGAARVVVAAHKGIKTDVARQLDAADEYIELDRARPAAQWAQLRQDNPYGFDVVVEATGAEAVANEAINYVRRGGTLMIYGVYENAARVHWPPSKIFGDEIKVYIGSFAQTHCFPRAVQYLDSGKIRVKGMVTDVFSIAEYQKALDKMNSRSALKIAVKP